jgi:hypothetical protein
MAKTLGPNFGNECIAAGLGGLPFAWGSDSDSISGRENLTVAQNATLDAVVAAHDPTKPLVPSAISNRQFFQQLAISGQITEQEALDAVATGMIPAKMAAIIATMPADQQFGAKMALASPVFNRDHPMVPVMQQGMGWTNAQTDDLWRTAVLL